MKQAIPLAVISVTSFVVSIPAVSMKRVSSFLLRCDIPCT